MSRHQRRRRLLAILARLGWQRDPGLWSIPCRDGHGCRAELSVLLGVGWVTLDCPAPGPLYLRPRQAGQARAALRKAVLDLALLGGAEMSGCAAPPAGEATVGRRDVLHWLQPARPTVAEIEARLVGATPAPEVDHPDAGSQLPRAAA